MFPEETHHVKDCEYRVALSHIEFQGPDILRHWAPNLGIGKVPSVRLFDGHVQIASSNGLDAPESLAAINFHESLLNMWSSGLLTGLRTNSISENACWPTSPNETNLHGQSEGAAEDSIRPRVDPGMA